MFKTEFIKLLQVINTYSLDTCMTMLNSVIKVQVHVINTYQGASEYASDYHIVKHLYLEGSLRSLVERLGGGVGSCSNSTPLSISLCPMKVTEGDLNCNFFTESRRSWLLHFSNRLVRFLERER